MLDQELAAEVEAIAAELRPVRHDLHQHPELGFEEHRTQAKVRSFLEARGWTPRPSAGTGLIRNLSQNRAGPKVALRADLDCLPIQEDTALSYRSIHPGKAHKCGHDGHTTILLGVAALLARHKDRVPGNVRLLFQPAEEGVRGGGAKVMLAEGALEGVSEVYGLHNWPAFPKGEVRVRGGPVMAQIHRFHIRIDGVGGHGSQPQLCKDPIVAGAHLVTALQTVVSRELSHEGGAVLSVGCFQAGTTDNIIPRTAIMKGTVRTFDPLIAQRVLDRMQALAEGNAKSFGVEVSLQVERGYPVLVNDPACASAVEAVAARVVGAGRVGPRGLPFAASEDFAYFTEAVPGAYFFLGAGKAGEETPVCHHPDFDFDDDLIPLGIRVFLGLVSDRTRALQAGAGKV